MAGAREEAQAFIDRGSWVVSYTDKVNSSAGATPENGIAPYPGYRPPRTTAAVQVTTPDISSIMAGATPSAPSHDLMRIIGDLGAVNEGLREEITTTRARNVGLSGRNLWLEDRNTWLEKCSLLGRDEIDRLQGRVLQYREELEKKALIIHQYERTISELHAAQLQTSSAIKAFGPHVNVIKQGLTELGKAPHTGEEEMEEDEEHVSAPVRPARIKIKGPARPASKSKQGGANEREDAAVAGPSSCIGKPKSAEEQAAQDARLADYRAQVRDMWIRDDTPEGYSKA